MATIWKFPLELEELQVISIPEGGEILHAGLQDGRMTLWARVDPDLPKEPRSIGIVGTGHWAPNDDEARYIGTVQQGAFVWHVFEPFDERRES